MVENTFTGEENRFNCPHCGTKLITFHQEGYALDDFRLGRREGLIFQHYLLRCNGCRRITYIQTQKEMTKEGILKEVFVKIQQPYSKEEVSEYIPKSVRKPYEEAIRGFNTGLLDSASGMCRKTIYKILDERGIKGSDYKDKIKNLGLDERITRPLLNIKNIGDESLHAESWDSKTIGKAIEALGIIMDLIYASEQKIKQFANHYSQANQSRNNETRNKG